MSTNNNIEENDLENEKEESMTTYYRSYREALKHSRAGDVIQLDPLRGYYITRPLERMKNIFRRVKWY